MRWNFGAVFAVAGTVLLWFFRGVIESWFFDKVLSMAPKPDWAWAVEYGPPTVFVLLALWMFLKGRASAPRLSALPAADNEFIPMQEAARVAYEQFRVAKVLYGVAADKLAHPTDGEAQQDATLRWMCHLLAPKVTVYGKHPPSRLRESIDPKEVKRLSFVDGGRALQDHMSRKTANYVDLEVRRTELNAAISALFETSSLGTELEAPPAKNRERSIEEFHEDAHFAYGFDPKGKEALEKAILLLARLRSEGVRIRNEVAAVHDATVEQWIERTLTWMRDTIDALRLVSTADAEIFSTLDVVPNARVLLPTAITQQHLADRLNSYYRQHDLRLVRLQELLLRYQSGRM